MTTYTFRIGQLHTDPQQGASLALHTPDDSAELRVRLCAGDSQLIALALAGLPTPATRLAQLVARLAEQLGARPSHVTLERTRGSLIEAGLVLATALETVVVPVTFGDAIVLAHVNRLPLQGDASLCRLLRVRPVEQEGPAAPPPAFAAFFEALGSE